MKKKIRVGVRLLAIIAPLVLVVYVVYRTFTPVLDYDIRKHNEYKRTHPEVFKAIPNK